MEIYLKKLDGALYPASEPDQEKLKKIKTGEAVKVKLTRVRNYQFHRKWWALINLAFDYWEPKEDWLINDANINLPVEKNLDRFRKDITILAGHYEQTVRLNGEIRTEAKSIAFANMNEREFEDLYQKTIDVIIKYVLTKYSGDELRSIVQQVEDFE